MHILFEEREEVQNLHATMNWDGLQVSLVPTTCLPTTGEILSILAMIGPIERVSDHHIAYQANVVLVGLVVDLRRLRLSDQS